MNYRVTAPVVRSDDQAPWAVGDIVDLPDGVDAEYLEPADDAKPAKRANRKIEAAAEQTPVETATEF